jgi:hypothetical protein
MSPDDRNRESARILDRVALEADSSPATRAVRAGRDHVQAADLAGDDRLELWGTRIGRSLALVVTAGLIVWLVLIVTGGA